MPPFESIQLLQKRMNASIIGLHANGNLLVEGLPGLAKTRAEMRMIPDAQGIMSQNKM